MATCAQCGGSGKVLSNISQNGKATYSCCGICAGSGLVSDEMTYYTTWSDESFKKACELINKYGKPIEVHIADDHDMRVTFKDGSKFVLGGFTVGYSGTGPSYCKSFLDAAGFAISREQIEEMRYPVTLIAGQSYIAPVTLVFKASTVEEAKKAAEESMPLDAKVISLEVFQAGNPKTIECEGTTEEIAFTKARGILPEKAIVEDEKVFDTEIITAEGFGDSESLAFKDAKRHLPEGAVVKQHEVVQVGSKGGFTVPASSDQNANETAQKQLPAGGSIQKIVCVQSMSKGFLGIGKRAGSYTVSWVVPYKIHLTTYPFKKAVLVYREPATVRLRFQPASK